MMSSFELKDFGCTINEVAEMVSRLHEISEVDGVGSEKLELMIIELKFLHVFAGYAHEWNLYIDAKKMDDYLLIKLEQLNSVSHAFIHACTQQEHHDWDPFASELLQEINVLKAEVEAAYQPGSTFSSLCTTTQEGSFSDHDLENLLDFVTLIFKYLLDYPLMKQMKALKWRGDFVGSLNSFPGDSPWWDKMRPLGESILIQTARLCCVCWYNLATDQILEQNVPIDLATPRFLAFTLRFLPCYDKTGGFDETGSEKSISDFLSYMLSLEDQTEILHKELVFLLTCLTRIPELENVMDDVQKIISGIKYVVMEAKSLPAETSKTHKAQLASLFGNIWSVKAEIFISGATFRRLFMTDHEPLAASCMEDRIMNLLEENKISECQPFQHDTDGYLQRLFPVRGAKGSTEDIIGPLLDKCMYLQTIFSVSGHMDALRWGCSFLKENLSPSGAALVEDHIWDAIEGAFHHFQSLYQSSTNEMPSIQVNSLPYQPLEGILSNANKLLLDLIEKGPNPMLSQNQDIRTLQEDLLFLRDVMTIHTRKETTDWEKLLRTDTIEVLLGVISLHGAIQMAKLHNPDTEEDAGGMDFRILELLNKVQSWTLKLRGVYGQIPKFNHPRTAGLYFLKFLLQKLRDLLNMEHGMIESAILLVKSISRDLEFIISEFEDVFKQDVWTEGFKDFHTRLSDAAHLAEYIVDSMVVGDATRQMLVVLHYAAKEIKQAKLQLNDFHRDDIPRNLMPVELQSTSTTTLQEAMIGLDDAKVQILNRVLGGGAKREIVSIVGVGGIGKSTLANHVFCSPSAAYHFDIRAQCHVSQTYNTRDLLLDILSGIITINDSIHALTNADLEEKLRKALKQKRYLILMDDVWDTGAWDALHKSFPDDSKGSRILITSRLQNLVSKICSDHHHLLRPLSEEESWKLLKLKIFGKEEECPEELLEIGKEIAARDWCNSWCSSQVLWKEPTVVETNCGKRELGDS
ncbi:OLC1v1004385C1 [Oldenlandia corymbosa var. corymbosa]|uniref:OLC1v1004385C1 n=1 Tax=Oldenlandia corymbosa var. corymbosa TaxID=529605 RepID=A0AAV1DC47_OLDCO|nr:OLC1v1004385C1 [Oldenlandia corymbosa var. corymbosa]